MHIDHQIAPYVVYGDDSITNALRMISGNRAGLIYCVSPHGRLRGRCEEGAPRDAPLT